MSCETAIQPHRIFCLLMAAGFSRRFGDADKRKQILNSGQTLLAATLQRLQPVFKTDAGWQLAVVLRQDEPATDFGLPEDVPILRAFDAADGLGASIANGVSQFMAQDLASGFEGLAIYLGDMPDIQTDSLNALIEQFEQARKEQPNQPYLLRPIYTAPAQTSPIPGHPVLFSPELWQELSTLTGDQGASPIIKQHHLETLAIRNTGIVRDLDLATDLHAQSSLIK